MGADVGGGRHSVRIRPRRWVGQSFSPRGSSPFGQIRPLSGEDAEITIGYLRRPGSFTSSSPSHCEEEAAWT
jgi:hypothetical protein